MPSIGTVCQQYLKDYCTVNPSGDQAAIQKRLADIERKFRQLDCDDSGDLDLEEIAKSLPSMTTEQIKDILSEVDDDNTGTLRLREFINFMLLNDKVISAPIPEMVIQAKPAAGGRRRGAFKKKKRGLVKLKLELKPVAGGAHELHADIIEAKDLLPMDFNGKADPFVKMYVLPDPKKKTKQKTKIIKCSLSPQWNQSFKWPIPAGTDLKQARLLISVYDWDRITQNDFMGEMSFSLEEILAGPLHGWYVLLDEKQGAKFNFRSRDQEHPTAGRSDLQVMDELPASGGTSGSSMRDTDFTYLKVLGRGNFGKVFLAEYKKTKQLCAVKVLKKEAIVEDNDIDCTIIERNVLTIAGGCPFLAHILGCFQTRANLFFVMELYLGGDLMFQVLKATKLPEATAAFYAAEICVGLWFLHERRIFYRDLKLDNVLLDSEGHVRIADFGLCKDLSKSPPEVDKTNTFCGTPNYLAPEIVRNESYGCEVDFWSLGVMVYEMMMGNVLFEADDEQDLYRLILTQRIKLSMTLSPQARTFISGLLDRNPPSRLGFGPKGREAIMRQPIFASLDWALLEKRGVRPPIVPTVGADPKDAVNFDSNFTSEVVILTPPKSALHEAEQAYFKNFSFTCAPTVA